MTAEQALIQYKGRDISEKLFSADKSFLGGQSMRVQSSEAVSTKIFIEFIALIVRNRIYNLLKETMQKLDGNPNYLTVPAALRELEKIRIPVPDRLEQEKTIETFEKIVEIERLVASSRDEQHKLSNTIWTI